MAHQSDPIEYEEYLRKKQKRKVNRKKRSTKTKWNKKIKALLSRFTK